MQRCNVDSITRPVEIITLEKLQIFYFTYTAIEIMQKLTHCGMISIKNKFAVP